MSTVRSASTGNVVTTAKAVRIRENFGINDLVVEELPIEQPKPTEVLVSIKAVSLNYRDLLLVKGHYNPKLKRPIIICSDCAGEVVAVGTEVTRFKVGDRVAGTFFQDWIDGRYTHAAGKSALAGGIEGVLTSARVFPEHGLVALPPALSYEEGATLPCAALTAWNALVPTARIKAGDSVLVLGTGGVSMFALQFAKAMGARVIVTSSSDDKLTRAHHLGAEKTINYRTHEDWDKEVLHATDGEGVDVVVEVGGTGTLAKSLRSVRPAGMVAVIGVLTGIQDSLNIAPILHNNVRMTGIYVGSRAMFEDMNKAIALNQIKPVVDKIFAFAEAKEALHHMESAQHLGKIVISLEY